MYVSILILIMNNDLVSGRDLMVAEAYRTNRRTLDSFAMKNLCMHIARAKIVLYYMYVY